MALTFLQLAHKVIQEENRPLSATEIWQIAKERGYDAEVATKGQTPWATLGALLYVDTRDNKNSIFTSVGARPKRFATKSVARALDNGLFEMLPKQTSARPDYLEKDLHAFLVYYGFLYLKAHLKTIKHNRSNKKEFGEWVHPDVVGCYFPFADWKHEVFEISALLGNTSIKLFSFEIKKELSISNIRESFFQAVSNSSWANEGYLVAAEIDNDDDFRKELERLSSSFGIGVIHLNTEDPDSSKIIFPARLRENIDWEMINKMANINPDFRDFLKRIKIDLTSKEIRNEWYDRVLSRDDLIKLGFKRM